jgi:mRNA interferase MazF
MAEPESFEVKRGEIYMLDWGEGGLHPALIIQNDTGNKYSPSTIVAYITHTVKDYPFMVTFKDHETSLEHGGSIDLSRIMTIPKELLREKKGHISSLKISQVNDAIKNSLGLE